VAVEKGTKAVISVDFSVYSERTFNILRTNFGVEFPGKEFFNSHGMFHQQLARALTREKASRFDSSRVADNTFTSSER
jgi:hypothetical protein